ncbi:MAG: FecR domain-containing protein [Actinomycetia bacterium]|nr:FecR domain-containing protein [Actinomycetes bacterium]
MNFFKGNPITTLSAVLLFLYVSLAGAENSNNPGALINRIEGDVFRKYIKVDNWTKARAQTSISVQESIHTYTRSKAELIIDNNKIIRLAPKTLINIISLLESNDSAKEYTELELEEGSVWANIDELDNDADFRITSDTAGTAVRGTVFSVSVDEQKNTEIKVYRGEVKVEKKSIDNTETEINQNKDVIFKKPEKIDKPYRVVSREEWTFIVSEMHRIIIRKDNNEKPEVTKFTSQDDKNSEMNKWIEWNLQMDSYKK